MKISCHECGSSTDIRCRSGERTRASSVYQPPSYRIMRRRGVRDVIGQPPLASFSSASNTIDSSQPASWYAMKQVSRLADADFVVFRCGRISWLHRIIITNCGDGPHSRLCHDDGMRRMALRCRERCSTQARPRRVIAHDIDAYGQLVMQALSIASAD